MFAATKNKLGSDSLIQKQGEDNGSPQHSSSSLPLAIVQNDCNLPHTNEHSSIFSFSHRFLSALIAWVQKATLQWQVGNILYVISILCGYCMIVESFVLINCVFDSLATNGVSSRRDVATNSSVYMSKSRFQVRVHFQNTR